MPGSRVKGQLSLNVLNLFDQSGVVDVFRVQTRENLPVPLETFFAGFDVQQRIANTAGIRIDPRFLQNSAWQAAREIRFGVKLIF